MLPSFRRKFALSIQYCSKESVGAIMDVYQASDGYMVQLDQTLNSYDS